MVGMVDCSFDSIQNVIFACFLGACFIRTDQLDGETDWKLKVAVGCTQGLPAVLVRMHYDVIILLKY